MARLPETRRSRVRPSARHLRPSNSGSVQRRWSKSSTSPLHLTYTGRGEEDCAGGTRRDEKRRRCSRNTAGQETCWTHPSPTTIPARQQPQLQAVEDVYRACLPAWKKKQHHANDGKSHRRVLGGELAHVDVAVMRCLSRAGAARGLLLAPRQLKTVRRARLF